MSRKKGTKTCMHFFGQPTLQCPKLPKTNVHTSVFLLYFCSTCDSVCSSLAHNLKVSDLLLLLMLMSWALQDVLMGVNNPYILLMTTTCFVSAVYL